MNGKDTVKNYHLDKLVPKNKLYYFYREFNEFLHLQVRRNSSDSVLERKITNSSQLRLTINSVKHLMNYYSEYS